MLRFGKTRLAHFGNLLQLSDAAKAEAVRLVPGQIGPGKHARRGIFKFSRNPDELWAPASFGRPENLLFVKNVLKTGHF